MGGATDAPKVNVDTKRMPRIPYLKYEEADESSRKLWDETTANSDIGPDGRPRPDTTHPMFLTQMRHPELSRAHSPFVQYLKNSTTLPVRQRELAVMRSAWLGGVDDQYVNHTAISLVCDLTQDEIDRIPAGADAPGWSAEDAAVLRAVDEMHYHCGVGDDTWAELARMYDDKQLIELLLLVGNYRTLSYIQNSIGIRPVRGETPKIPGNRFMFGEQVPGELAKVPKVSVDTARMPRIPYLTYEESTGLSRATWDAVRARNDALPEGSPKPDTTHPMFLTGMRHPELKKLHQPFVQYLKYSETLPIRERELAIMRSAWLGGVDDQFVNHTQIGMECGLTKDELDAIPAGPDAPRWSAHDAAILRAVDELHYHCGIGDDTWAELAKTYDAKQLIELLLLVGNYRSLSYIQNSIGIRPVRGKTPNIPGNRFLFVES